MFYPDVKLSDVQGSFHYAEHDEEERGSFLSIVVGADGTTIRVDRFSTIPFYYALHKGSLYGATKLDLLLEDLPKDFSRKLDAVAAIEFLRMNCMLGDKTLLEGVARIPPGSELRFDKATGELKITNYWKLPGDVRRSYNQNTALRDLHDSFSAAIKRMATDEKEIGMHLSGGMDSRQVLGALLEQGVHVKAFTYGIEENLDVVITRQLAKQLRLDHVYVKWEGVDRFRTNFPLQMVTTDGMQALIHGHGIDMFEIEKDQVNRVIIGHFVDLFIQAHGYKSAFEGEGRDLDSRFYHLFNGGSCSVISGDDLEPAMVEKPYHGCYRESIMQEIRKFDYMIPEKRYDALYFVHHGLRRLMPQIQSGAHFLDCRVPGLDSEFFDVSWSIPGSIRKYRALQARLLRDCYSETVDHTPVVMNNNSLAYMGNHAIPRAAIAVDRILRNKRFHILRPYYQYYGSGLLGMANAHLFDWMRDEITQSPLGDMGFLKSSFIRHLFSTGEFRPEIGINFYGALMTLHWFVERYVENAGRP